MNVASKPESSHSQKALNRKLAAHPFLFGLTPSQIEVLTSYAVPTEFRPGQVVFHQGEMANSFYLVLAGEVALEAEQEGGNVAFVDRVCGGEVLGWSWLFPPYTWQFTARAQAPTQAVFFYGTWLRERCEQDPALGFELMRRMTNVIIRRLQSTRQHLLAQAKPLGPD